MRTNFLLIIFPLIRLYLVLFHIIIIVLILIKLSLIIRILLTNYYIYYGNMEIDRLIESYP